MRRRGDGKRRLITTDELRRCIEDLGPGAYDELSYYERWIASITNNLLEKGDITADELGRRLAQIGEAWPAGAGARAAKLPDPKPCTSHLPAEPTCACAPAFRTASCRHPCCGAADPGGR